MHVIHTHSYLFWVTADSVSLADIVALYVVAVGSSFAVEVGPGCSSGTLTDRGGPTRLETVRAVVDAGGSAVRTYIEMYIEETKVNIKIKNRKCRRYSYSYFFSFI